LSMRRRRRRNKRAGLWCLSWASRRSRSATTGEAGSITSGGQGVSLTHTEQLDKLRSRRERVRRSPVGTFTYRRSTGASRNGSGTNAKTVCPKQVI
jgi:hypothetical protein